MRKYSTFDQTIKFFIILLLFSMIILPFFIHPIFSFVAFALAGGLKIWLIQRTEARNSPHYETPHSAYMFNHKT